MLEVASYRAKRIKHARHALNARQSTESKCCGQGGVPTVAKLSMALLKGSGSGNSTPLCTQWHRRDSDATSFVWGSARGNSASMRRRVRHITLLRLVHMQHHVNKSHTAARFLALCERKAQRRPALKKQQEVKLMKMHERQKNVRRVRDKIFRELIYIYMCVCVYKYVYLMAHIDG